MYTYSGTGCHYCAIDQSPSYREGATHLFILSQPAEHDNGSALELPHHPPEVIHCVMQWSLRGYVGIALLVALHTTHIHTVTHCITSCHALLKKSFQAIGPLQTGQPILTHVQEAGIDVLCPSHTRGPQPSTVHVVWSRARTIMTNVYIHCACISESGVIL